MMHLAKQRIGTHQDIWQFFPKKTDFNLIHHNTIKSVENKINNRPIRKFNYLSANEVFLQLKI